MKSTLFSVLAVICCIVSAQQVSCAVSDEPPIRIGATVSLEGPYKEPSLMIKQAFELWESEINQKGGLLGRKVKLIFYNDKSQPKLAAKYYQKMIEEDHVELVFSPYGTPLTLEASDVSERHKYVMLACAASSEKIWDRGFRYVFGIYAQANRYFIGLLELMARKGINDIALIYNSKSSFNTDVAKGVKKWSKNFRMGISYEQPYNDGKQDLPDIVATLKEKGLQNVILSAYPPDCYLLLDLLKKNDIKPQVLGMTIAPIHPDFWQKSAGMADRVFGPSQWEPIERIPFPGTNQFVSQFKQFSGKMPSYHAGAAYAACQLYEAAVNKNGSIDHEKIREYIAALDTVTVIGRFKVDLLGKQIGHNPIIIQWQNGKKEIVWPVKMQTATPLF